MEIEALGAIYMDNFQIINDDNIQITLIPNPGGDDNFVGIILDIKFTTEYPNEIPNIELIPHLKLTKDKIQDLHIDIVKQANENIGTSMIFILAGVIKEWLDQNNVDPDLVEEVEEVEESSSEEEEEQERVFDGTPVTVETFNQWKIKFLQETQPIKKEKITNKLTGRQLFQTDASLSTSDNRFMEEGEESTNFNLSTIKAKIEDIAQQVDWSLFKDEDIPEDFDIEEDEEETDE
ncbi:hypothetical protein DLAC_08008 [Tieghemostelium lacteum]|uniref:RWD domain-containing protein n=1 Tax=Tieghemostelium lacteum TaxID=361077 RepID=A0A151ZAX2_TIELA|nr:hypothetical protein DLAC_08008 [Tieghemostelium lacteum]|eukprot:KYQ91102.1 hypothetical protein DLAC_08008 [Tieghemostelium lacteum]